MKVLVVDSGGRGHAIARQFKNDPGVKEVICAPGNVGIATEIRCENARGNEEILELSRREKVDLVFIGPESPLTNGVVDLLTSESIPVVGPAKKASILEGSKAYTKLLCRELGVPVADFEVFDDPQHKIFFAGVSNSEKKGMVTDGGRVFHVIGKGNTLQEARDVAYRNIELVHFEGMRFRTDIGKE